MTQYGSTDNFQIVWVNGQWLITTDANFTTNDLIGIGYTIVSYVEFATSPLASNGSINGAPVVAQSVQSVVLQSSSVLVDSFGFSVTVATDLLECHADIESGVEISVAPNIDALALQSVSELIDSFGFSVAFAADSLECQNTIVGAGKVFISFSTSPFVASANFQGGVQVPVSPSVSAFLSNGSISGAPGLGVSFPSELLRTALTINGQAQVHQAIGVGALEVIAELFGLSEIAIDLDAIPLTASAQALGSAQVGVLAGGMLSPCVVSITAKPGVSVAPGADLFSVNASIFGASGVSVAPGAEALEAIAVVSGPASVGVSPAAPMVAAVAQLIGYPKLAPDVGADLLISTSFLYGTAQVPGAALAQPLIASGQISGVAYFRFVQGILSVYFDGIRTPFSKVEDIKTPSVEGRVKTPFILTDQS